MGSATRRHRYWTGGARLPITRPSPRAAEGRARQRRRRYGRRPEIRGTAARARTRLDPLARGHQRPERNRRLPREDTDQVRAPSAHVGSLYRIAYRCGVAGRLLAPAGVRRRSDEAVRRGPEYSFRWSTFARSSTGRRSPKVFTDPVGLLQARYQWGTPTFNGAALVENLSALLEARRQLTPATGASGSRRPARRSGPRWPCGG